MLNSIEPFFIGFGPDGEILRLHGSEGGGPGEFQAPSGFVTGGINGEGMLQRIDATPQQLADLLPRCVDLRCADDGTLWIRPLDLEIGGLRGGPAWLRIGPEGAMDEVHFPIRFDPYRFTAARVWGVQRDELDVASVAWIAVPPA